MSHQTLRKPQVNHMTQIYKTTKASDCLKKQEYSCFRSLTTCLTKFVRPVLAVKLLMRWTCLLESAAHQPARQLLTNRPDMRMWDFLSSANAPFGDLTPAWDLADSQREIRYVHCTLCLVQLFILPNCKRLWCYLGKPGKITFSELLSKNPCFLNIKISNLDQPLSFGETFAHQ